MTYRRIITVLLILTFCALLMLAWVLTPQLGNVSTDVLAVPTTKQSALCQYVTPAVNFNIQTPWYAAAWLRNAWRYQSPVPYRWLYPKEALTLKKGYCIDYANLLCSDLRHFGLDAWVVVGTVPTTTGGKHAWVECAYGKHIWYMDVWHNYIALPQDWHEDYRYNEALVIGLR